MATTTSAALPLSVKMALCARQRGRKQRLAQSIGWSLAGKTQSGDGRIGLGFWVDGIGFSLAAGVLPRHACIACAVPAKIAGKPGRMRVRARRSCAKRRPIARIVAHTGPCGVSAPAPLSSSRSVGCVRPGYGVTLRDPPRSSFDCRCFAPTRHARARTRTPPWRP